VTDPRTQLVAETYDVIADRFADWRDEIVGDPRRLWLEALASRLTDGAPVLELGCGAGVPDTRLLAERFAVTGVDISAEQIARARANLPTATFVHADFTSIDFPKASFAAVASFYAFNHVPRELLAGLFARIHSWLVPGGYFLASLGAGDEPGWTGEWLGATTFFSGYPPEVNRELLMQAGFVLELDEVVTFREPEGDVAFHWILGRT
jgi:cyclopropane fatty-acyl-phospholipid synthase-like methyltransferase